MDEDADIYPEEQALDDALLPTPCQICDAILGSITLLNLHLSSKHGGNPPDYTCEWNQCLSDHHHSRTNLLAHYDHEHISHVRRRCPVRGCSRTSFSKTAWKHAVKHLLDDHSLTPSLTPVLPSGKAVPTLRRYTPPPIAQRMSSLIRNGHLLPLPSSPIPFYELVAGLIKGQRRFTKISHHLPPFYKLHAKPLPGLRSRQYELPFMREEENTHEFMELPRWIPRVLPASPSMQSDSEGFMASVEECTFMGASEAEVESDLSRLSVATTTTPLSESEHDADDEPIEEVQGDEDEDETPNEDEDEDEDEEVEPRTFIDLRPAISQPLHHSSNGIAGALPLASTSTFNSSFTSHVPSLPVFYVSLDVFTGIPLHKFDVEPFRNESDHRSHLIALASPSSSSKPPSSLTMDPARAIMMERDEDERRRILEMLSDDSDDNDEPAPHKVHPKMPPEKTQKASPKVVRKRQRSPSSSDDGEIKRITQSQSTAQSQASVKNRASTRSQTSAARGRR